MSKSICKGICEHLFLPVLKDVYLFKDASRETLLCLATKMKPEYILPREDVVVQNEAAEDVYVVVSDEVEVILFDGVAERVEATLHQVEIHGMKVEDLLGDNTGEHDDANVLTVVAMGNSSLLEDLLKHVATYKGYEDCELVLL
ncbi:hypothetical protein U9M48_044061 [Paspalum notatum var. saurae]|uniref:Cyclic nucleotide-binding domain-containing protein n=1 Tax=Paspalum notatum var. saurae TaxID=547442 RepID=A0AAQ3XH39_PASNO